MDHTNLPPDENEQDAVFLDKERTVDLSPKATAAPVPAPETPLSSGASLAERMAALRAAPASEPLHSPGAVASHTATHAYPAAALDPQWQQSVIRTQRRQRVLIFILFLMLFFMGAALFGVMLDTYFRSGYGDASPPAHGEDAERGLFFYEETSPTFVPTPRPARLPLPSIGGNKAFESQSSSLVADIAAFVSPSSVRVYITENKNDRANETLYEELLSDGSGIVLSQDGYILTNYHVISNGQTVYVSFLDDEQEPWPAQIIGIDPIRDIAVIKVDRNDCTPALFGDSNALRPGEMAVSIGNSLGNGSGTVTQGIVSAVNRSITMDGGHRFQFIQTDAAINPGNSGGPLVNSKAEVIGVNTIKQTIAGLDEAGDYIYAEGVGYAIPINEIMELLPDLITTGVVERPALGVIISDINNPESKILLQQEGLDHGVLIHAIVPHSPCDLAGIQVDDILLTVNGSVLENSEQLNAIVRSSRIGDVLDITLRRAGVDLSVKVTLDDMNAIDYEKAYEQ